MSNPYSFVYVLVNVCMYRCRQEHMLWYFPRAPINVPELIVEMGSFNATTVYFTLCDYWLKKTFAVIGTETSDTAPIITPIH